MTLTTTTNRISYVGSGLTGPYAFPFRIFTFTSQPDLEVIKTSTLGTDSTLVYPTDYSVSGAGNATGSITLTTALAVGEVLNIRRSPALTQGTSIRNQGEYNAAIVEDEFDRIVMQMQALKDLIDRSVGVVASGDPALLSLRLKPDTGKALVWQSSTALGNATIDTTGIALPGEGRTVPTTTAYLLNNRVYNTDDYLSISADLGARINYILTQVGKTAATIIVPDVATTFAVAIDLIDSRAIRITCERSGNLNSVTDWGPNLIWTGGAGSGPAVKGAGSIGLEWDHINLSYNNAAYDGNLISLGIGIQDCSTPHFHHCRISGTPTAKLAARLIELNGTLAFTIDNTTLDYAVIGIGCSGSSCNGVYIGENCWFDKHFTDCCLKAWGHVWTIGAIVQECDPTGGVPLTPLFKLAGDSSTIAFKGCWSGDGGNGGGTIIDLDTGGFTCWGVDICMFAGHASGTFLKCSTTQGFTTGLNVHGSRIDSLAVGIHLGRCHGATIQGNQIKSTVPWTGTSPTNYWISNNEYGTNTTSGLTIADSTDIPITLPGSSTDGRGTIFVWATEDNAQAVYELNGSAGTVTEVRDTAGLFSPTKDNGGTINIYWDGPSNSYRLQNKRLVSRTVAVNSIIAT